MPDGEWESYRHHVAECDECAGEGRRARLRLATRCSARVPQLSAPPEIRDRVMSVVRAEAELLQRGRRRRRPARAREPRAALGLRAAAPAGRPARWRRRCSRSASAAARCCAAAADVHDAPATSIACAPAPTAPRASCSVCDGSAQARRSPGMQAPPEGRIYQLWLDDRDDAPRPKPTEALFSVARRPRVGRRPAS